MKALGEQWVEVKPDGEHMYKAVMVNGTLGCKDLGILKDGLLPCPFCGEYPEVRLKGNNATKKRSAEMRCIHCNISMVIGAIRNSLEWCESNLKDRWNRRT